jgi:sugar transferase (PEP-CTERM/EpsH1 system associated)
VHIAWLKTELLHPIDKGGKIRTYQMLRELRREHEITYVTLDDGQAAPDALERATEYAHEVVRVPFRQTAKRTPAFYAELARNVASPLPFAIAKYRSPAMRDAIRALLRRRDVDVLVCDFLFPSINVDRDLPCPTVLFQHNVEAAIWARHTQVATHPVKRLYFREQWRRMRAFEEAECRRFDHVIAVSAEDEETFRRDYGVRNVSSVPTGVDTDYFSPASERAPTPHSLVFTGSMDWLPNEDAIRFFTRDVLPLVRAQVPDVTLTVVGRNPPAHIRALADEASAIRVTGSVPDVRPYLEGASVFVVPIRIGGGTRLKIYEAMAMELPVVSTTVGAEGLPLRSGVDAILADEPADLATAIVKLLRDPALVRRIGQTGAERVRQEFSWQRVAAAFSEICEGVATQNRPEKLPV